MSSTTGVIVPVELASRVVGASSCPPFHVKVPATVKPAPLTLASQTEPTNAFSARMRSVSASCGAPTTCAWHRSLLGGAMLTESPANGACPVDQFSESDHDEPSPPPVHTSVVPLAEADGDRDDSAGEECASGERGSAE